MKTFALCVILLIYVSVVISQGTINHSLHSWRSTLHQNQNAKRGMIDRVQHQLEQVMSRVAEGKKTAQEAISGSLKEKLKTPNARQIYRIADNSRLKPFKSMKRRKEESAQKMAAQKYVFRTSNSKGGQKNQFKKAKSQKKYKVREYRPSSSGKKQKNKLTGIKAHEEREEYSVGNEEMKNENEEEDVVPNTLTEEKKVKFEETGLDGDNIESIKVEVSSKTDLPIKNLVLKIGRFAIQRLKMLEESLKGYRLEKITLSKKEVGDVTKYFLKLKMKSNIDRKLKVAQVIVAVHPGKRMELLKHKLADSDNCFC